MIDRINCPIIGTHFINNIKISANVYKEYKDNKF